MKKSLGLKIGVVVAAVLVCLFAIFPFIWMISVSFKPASEVYAAPTLFPKAPTLDGYKAMLSTTGAFSFTTWLRNSVIVSLCTTLFSLIIATLGAYGISRFHFKGRSALSYIILTTQVIPGALIVVPMYVIMGNMNLLDNMFGLILAYTTFTVPFCTWMMKGYFDSISPTIDEAAMVDGANRFQVFSRIVLPARACGYHDLRLHLRLERIRVRQRPAAQLQQLDAPHRYRQLPGAIRHQLGHADGRGRHDHRPSGHHLLAAPEASGRRYDGGRRQGLILWFSIFLME